MIPPSVVKLCKNGLSVSAQLAKDPSTAPSHVCKELFHTDSERDVSTEGATHHERQTPNPKPDLQTAAECGNWGSSQPSDLFLSIFHDVLSTLRTDPLIDVCSPSLIGTNGVSPLLIVSGIPDIARHMSNLIARADREVFLATNFWMYSEPSRLITNALHELSHRAGETNRRVVVKIMYDRGDLKQFVENHQSVHADVYADSKGKIRLPHPDDVPNLDLEVVNYHRPLLGTFHAKFMVVDRNIALLQSNNIQDNDNMEMMCQFEGDIVDSVYDTALISWHNEMKPPFPCLDTPSRSSKPPSFNIESQAKLFNEKGENLHSYDTQHTLPPGATTVTDAVEQASQKSLPQHSSSNPHYDIDIASEMLRSIATLNPGTGQRRIDMISKNLNTTPENHTTATAPDVTDPTDLMSPFIPLPPHQPFPIAVVNREPFGPPTSSSLHVPQNLSWISGLRHAAKSVLIQTPDLNAAALLPEILAAARREVNISIIYCLGYNDAGELLPLQGGHNEGVAHSLYKQLEPEYHDYLNYYCYVAKDQIRPIHNSHKQRSCHVKLMIVDDHIGIMGSGNQDTQSWYHSQEINVMIDSPLVVGRWYEAIRRNQNSLQYGACRKGNPNEDSLVGCWVDPETGKMADGAIGIDAGRFSWARGAIGAAGITHVFVNLGSDHPAIVEAIVKGQKEKKGAFPRIITCPNEMVALSLADGYARLSNKPQCVIIHVDVGTQALAAAVHNASVGRAPVLIFAGLSPYTVEGEYRGSRTEYIHWMQDVPDQKAIVAQYCRYTGEIKRGANVKQIVNRALQFATSAPQGPVYLYGSREAMEEEIVPYHLNQSQWLPVAPSALPQEAVKLVGDHLVAAKEPLLIVGYTGRNASAVPATVSLADAIPGLRVLDTGGSDMCFPSTHPAWLGFRHGNHPAIKTADFILVLDCDVPWIPTLCKPSATAKIIHIDIDPLKQTMPVFYIPAFARYRADSTTALREINGYLASRTNISSTHSRQQAAASRQKAHNAFRADIASLSKLPSNPTKGPINASVLVAQVRAHVPQDTIFAVEAVTLATTVADQVAASLPKSWINCGGGGLGWSGGGALGIKLASDYEEGTLTKDPNTSPHDVKPNSGRFVTQIVGDGSYLFSVPSSVYWISRRYDIPILTIVLNNKGWNAPRHSMLLVHPRGEGSKVDNRALNISFEPTPDYSGIAKAASGGKAWAGTVQDVKGLLRELPNAIRAVKDEARSAVLEVRINWDQEAK
ncbi:hypothetical protein DV736_g4676, partial [Chaetothyriales sp. CBS 134916]